jgi:dTDP-glucose 4,6-dehydratase
MKVLVIGCNSFSGSNFCNFLIQKKIKVIGVSRSENLNTLYLKHHRNINKNKFFFFQKVDINKDIDKLINLIKKFHIEYIVNYAAQAMVAESWLMPEHWYKTNVLSHSIILKKISEIKFIKKYLNFSTPEVYGSTDKLIFENQRFNPSTPYAVSRAAQDMSLYAYFKTLNFPVVITRAANVYGPHQKPYRIIPKTIISCLKNYKIPLHGGGSSVRSFIHIDDVNRAVFSILIDKKNLGETYNISTNKFLKIKELVDMIIQKLNCKNNLIKMKKERQGKDFGYFLSSIKLRKRYKWKDEVPLDLGLDEVIHWVNANINQFSKSDLDYLHVK